MVSLASYPMQKVWLCEGGGSIKWPTLFLTIKDVPTQNDTLLEGRHLIDEDNYRGLHLEEKRE